jgi:hypothetical protein
MDQVERRWLKCEVFPGLFDTEFLVSFREKLHGNLVSIFVDSSLVRADGKPGPGKPVPGQLRVFVRRTEQGWVDVTLPVPTSDLGSVVAVPEEQLAAA